MGTIDSHAMCVAELSSLGTHLGMIPHGHGHFDGHLDGLVSRDVQHFEFLCVLGDGREIERGRERRRALI